MLLKLSDSTKDSKFISTRNCSGCGIQTLCLQGTRSNSKTMKIKIQRIQLLWQLVINTYINTNHIHKTPYHLLTQAVITHTLSSGQLSNIKRYIWSSASICTPVHNIIMSGTKFKARFLLLSPRV
jgi:hypothetical protein